MNIPITVLIEANECLKLARPTAPPGSYVRLLDAQTRLEFALTQLLAGKTVEVQA